MSKVNLGKRSTFIKDLASELGFISCGISKADFLEEEAPRLEQWLRENRHGKMSYMENHFDKRLDPTLLVEDSKSVVSLLLNYYPSEFQNEDSFKVSTPAPRSPRAASTPLRSGRGRGYGRRAALRPAEPADRISP